MEHIVQIAFDFDDERVRQTIENTVKKEVIDGIQTDITKALLHNFGSWNGAWNHSKESAKESALVDLMRERTDDFLKENKDVILEAAAKNLSERLARSKKGKELLEGLEKEV